MPDTAMLQICHANIHTYCFGLAASMGAFLLGAGTHGHRASMPNSRIMIHQPLGGASGQAVDIEIQAREIMYHKANINRIMAEYTGQQITTARASATCLALSTHSVGSKSVAASLCLQHADLLKSAGHVRSVAAALSNHLI